MAQKKKKKKTFLVTVWWWVVWRWLNHPMTLELVRPPPPAKYGVAEPPQASGSSTPLGQIEGGRTTRKHLGWFRHPLQLN